MIPLAITGGLLMDAALFTQLLSDKKVTNLKKVKTIGSGAFYKTKVAK